MDSSEQAHEALVDYMKCRLEGKPHKIYTIGRHQWISLWMRLKALMYYSAKMLTQDGKFCITCAKTWTWVMWLMVGKKTSTRLQLRIDLSLMNTFSRYFSFGKWRISSQEYSLNNLVRTENIDTIHVGIGFK